jgi:CheY-like chemotaxis protein
MLIMKIVIIDDEPDICLILSLELNDLGCETITFASAVEAQTYFLHATSDLIICDFQMPQMNGYEFFLWLQASGKQIPFVILTGEAHLDRAQLLAVGVCAVLYKPGDVQHIPELIARFRPN